MSARDRAKAAPLIGGAEWFDDPVALARAPGIDVFVELIGGHEGVAREAVEAALASGKIGRHRQQGAARPSRHGAGRRRRGAGASLSFEAAVAGGIPAIKVLREA